MPNRKIKIKPVYVEKTNSLKMTRSGLLTMRKHIDSVQQRANKIKINFSPILESENFHPKICLA
jgi:hypothetical protein